MKFLVKSISTLLVIVTPIFFFFLDNEPLNVLFYKNVLASLNTLSIHNSDLWCYVTHNATLVEAVSIKTPQPHVHKNLDFYLTKNALNHLTVFENSQYVWAAPAIQEYASSSTVLSEYFWNLTFKNSRFQPNVDYFLFDDIDNFLSRFYSMWVCKPDQTNWDALRFFVDSFFYKTTPILLQNTLYLEARFYNLLYSWGDIFFEQIELLSINFFYFFLVFFVMLVLVSIIQPYLGFKGVFRLLLLCLSLLFLAITPCLVLLANNGAIFFLEIKIYTIYAPNCFNTVSFSIDYLSAAFMFLVTAIGFSATIYARVYLYGDPNSSDFMIKLLWFVFSMLSLVIARNIFFLYLSWEFIGITSMWLINFNSQRTDTFKSAIKAFTFNKISDLCLFSSLLIGYLLFKSTTLSTWNIDSFLLSTVEKTPINYLHSFSVLLLIAACIKSAQLGFHLWLPDSMDAPVPASALIHSATLVSAGVYLLLRFYDLVQISGLTSLVALIGASTAAYGGVVAGMQTDLKRALAYSTISHCGFLFTLTAIGGSSTALLYLFLHGFFKALSFICAGDFIRLSSGYQDLNRMGGFFFLNPSLSAQFLIAMGNLCGLPFFIGYFFKSNLQVLLINNNNSINSLLCLFIFIGFLSSILYFFKVFYCVVFSFKKTNYKNLHEFYKAGLMFFKYPLKSPKALMVVFWFIYFTSLICIFKYFDFTSGGFNCVITDLQMSSMSNNVYSNNSLLHTKTETINYLFMFYTFFTAVAYTLIVVYACRRSGWPSLVNSITLIIFFIIFSCGFL